MNIDDRNGVFSPKDPREIVALNFDFTIFGTGFSNITVTCQYYSGITDPAAAAMVTGGAAVEVSGVITKDLQLGVHDTDYLVTCQADRGTNRYVVSGILPVRNAVGGYSQSEIF